MGQKFLLDTSPTGVQHYAHIEDDGDTLITEEFTPSSVEEKILDDCSRMRSVAQRPGAFKLAARIPVGLYQVWKKEWREKWADKYTWQQFEVIKLNSRDNCNLRTNAGRGVFGKKL